MIVPGVLDVVGPSGAARPLLFDLPHSGRDYPADFGSALPPEILRRGEDAYVDELLADAPGHGVTVLKALFPRCYIDTNRDEDDVDPELVSDALPEAFRPSDKSLRGIGLIRRDVVPEHRIYDRLLSHAEVKGRIERYHRPYHEALSKQLDLLRGMFGAVCHVDWHSMKSARNANTPDGPGVDQPGHANIEWSWIFSFGQRSLRWRRYRAALREPRCRDTLPSDRDQPGALPR